MVTAMEDACPSGGQEEAEMNPEGPPDVASVSTQPSRGEDRGRGVSQVGVGVDERLVLDCFMFTTSCNACVCYDCIGQMPLEVTLTSEEL